MTGLFAPFYFTAAAALLGAIAIWAFLPEHSPPRLHHTGSLALRWHDARIIPSVQGWIYAYDQQSVYVNLFVASEAAVPVGDRAVMIKQVTRYPWEGDAQGIDLVVVADDFGASSTVNHAVIEAHEAGIVTAASLMAGGDSFEEGIRLARSHPRLSVGLHATLCDGRAVLPTDRIPGMAGEGGWLEPSPARAGWRYGLRWRALRHEIESELAMVSIRCRSVSVCVGPPATLRSWNSCQRYCRP